MSLNIVISAFDSCVRPAVERAFARAGFDMSAFRVMSESEYEHMDNSRDIILWLSTFDDSDSLPLPDELNGGAVYQAPLRLGAFLDAAIRYKHLATQHLKKETLIIGSYELDIAHNLLNARKGHKTIRLTEKESHILKLLARQKNGAPLSRQALLDEVWGYVPGVETHTLETHIYRLRQKLEADPANPAVLVTDDEGYRLV